MRNSTDPKTGELFTTDFSPVVTGAGAMQLHLLDLHEDEENERPSDAKSESE